MQKLAQIRTPIPGTEVSPGGQNADITKFTEGVATLQGFEWIFTNVVTVVLAISGLALFVMLIKGGMNILTSGSDAGKMQAGQKTITWAIGGIVFLALSFLIIQLISFYTGVNSIQEFKIYRP